VPAVPKQPSLQPKTQDQRRRQAEAAKKEAIKKDAAKKYPMWK